MTTKSHLFQRLRQAHDQEKAEDYVELIAALITEHGEARLTQIAKAFEVRAVTAHKILARLHREGWIEITPYQPIRLTKKGKVLAAKSKRRHQLVLQFLICLGVPESIARLDAEGIEHHVSRETLAAFSRFLQGFKS